MDEVKKHFWVFGFPPLLWMGVIFCLSSIPGRYISGNWFLHQLGHLIEYFVFGVLLARALAHLKVKLNVWKLSFLSVVLIILFAAFDEWRQSLVPGRSSKFITVFFDGAYATLGVAAYSQIVFFFLMRKRKKMRSRRSALSSRSGDGAPPAWL